MNLSKCKFELVGDIVLCKPLEQKKKNNSFSFEVPAEEIQLYEIIDLHFSTKDAFENFGFKIGDVVVTSINVVPIEIGGEKICIYHPVSIVAKIKD